MMTGTVAAARHLQFATALEFFGLSWPDWKRLLHNLKANEKLDLLGLLACILHSSSQYGNLWGVTCGYIEVPTSTFVDIASLALANHLIQLAGTETIANTSSCFHHSKSPSHGLGDQTA